MRPLPYFKVHTMNLDIMQKNHWDELSLLVKEDRLPDRIRNLAMGDSVRDEDRANTIVIRRVKGGVEFQIWVRGGIPCFALGGDGQGGTRTRNGNTRIFPHNRTAFIFVAVPDSQFRTINDYFHDPLEISAGDDIINIKAEDVTDANRQIWNTGEEPPALS